VILIISERIKTTVCDVLSRVTLIGDDIYRFDDDLSLMEFGLDSYQLITVIIEIETLHGIKFSDEQLIANNFNTINNIIASIKEALNEKL